MSYALFGKAGDCGDGWAAMGPSVQSLDAAGHAEEFVPQQWRALSFVVQSYVTQVRCAPMPWLQRIPRRLLVAGFWAAVVVIGVMALLPATVPLPSTGWDKANHALAFALLAIVGLACWPEATWRVLIGLGAYGGAIEIAQTFTETRMGEWVDWLADLAGLVVAAGWYRYSRRPGEGRDPASFG